MAIQELTIQGYRSFKNVCWKPGKLNLLVGPNGSGKSNLLRLLELISNVAKGQLVSAINESEGIVPLLWNHEVKSFGWKMRIDPVDDWRDIERDALTLEFEVEQTLRGSAFQITKDTLGSWYGYEQDAEKSPYWIYTRDARRGHYYDQAAGNLRKVEELSFDDFNSNESLLPQIDARSNVIPPRAKLQLEAWRVYHDVHVDRSSPMRMPIVTQLSTNVESDGSNLAAVLHTLYTGNREFKKLIDEGMKAAFGEEYLELTFLPAAKQQIQLAVQWKSSRDPHAGQELSDGTLRYLLLLTVLSNPDPATVIAIDEPEIGLHPSMLPMIAEYAIAASEQTQIILSSHSPELLDAFSSAESTVTLFHWEEGESHLYSLLPHSLRTWLERYRLGSLFTSGELDLLAANEIEPLDDINERLNGLPSEDAALSSTDG